MPSAHIDTFAQEHLPPQAQWPVLSFERPELQFPAQLNCVAQLLDRHVQEGRGERVALRAPGGLAWSYRELQAKVDAIAHVLVQRLGLVPGNRVLLRAPNNPMLAACWLAVVKAGGIAVATMPLLRAKELATLAQLGQVSHALCDARLADELNQARSLLAHAPHLLGQTLYFNAEAGGAAPGASAPQALEVAMAAHAQAFAAVNTAADDTCLLAFTSGTTGVPKATMHFHRDVMAACRAWPAHVLRAGAQDVFIGSPPLAFTFGLGGLLLFPMDIGASTVLLEKASPEHLLQGAREFGASVLITSPTAYRAMGATRAIVATNGVGPSVNLPHLRKCVSAGEALPASTRALWKQASGLELIDGIGATEMLHIFISHREDQARPGATGLPVPGYEAQVVDGQGQPVPPGTVGRLRVRGPTGCRYLADERQRQYVQDGWNYPGDAYVQDADGYFFHQARTDDMIVSAGYNIAGPEVEEALLAHPAVAECGVAGVPDAQRGHIVKAWVVLRSGFEASDALAVQLQDFVKQQIAPYKYPRAIAFASALPRTATGKLQRYRLKDI